MYFYKKKKNKTLFFKTNFDLSGLGTRFLVLEIYKLSNAKPFFALIKNRLGFSSIVYLPHRIFFGSILKFFSYKSLFIDIRQNGFFLRLIFFKAGDSLCNIFFDNNIRRNWALSAGAYCRVLYKTHCGNFLVIQLPSGLEKRVSTKFFGILGRFSNIYHKKEMLGSAGFSHHLGTRPSVRGIAMNPVDHPHGGRTNTIKPEVSPWGWVTKFRH